LQHRVRAELHDGAFTELLLHLLERLQNHAAAFDRRHKGTPSAIGAPQGAKFSGEIRGSSHRNK
jgi:hypothetical protein